MTNHEIRLGNLFGGTGGNWAGMVYSTLGLCPTLRTPTGGGALSHTFLRRSLRMKNSVILLGGVYGHTHGGYGGSVFATYGCSPTILTPTGGGTSRTLS